MLYKFAVDLIVCVVDLLVTVAAAGITIKGENVRLMVIDSIRPLLGN